MRTLFALLPEVLVVAAALAVLLERPLRLRRYGWLPLGVAAVVLVALGWELVEGVRVAVLFHGGVVQDRFALFAKAGLLAAAFLTLLATEWAPGSRPMAGLTLLTCFGGMVAASATDLAGLWAGLALAVLAAVATAAIRDGPFAARPVLVLGGWLVASAAGTAALGDLPYGLDGLAERGPARALAFTACVLSLAGVPPL